MRYTLIVFFALFILLPIHAYADNPYLLTNPEGLFAAPEKTRREILVREFSSYAIYYAARKGYRFGSGAQSTFERGFSINAADAMMKISPKVYEREKKKIREKYRILIDAMIQAAESMEDYKKRHPRVIGEQTLMKALKSICPLWPFCR